MKLFPLLANVFAIMVGSQHMNLMYKQMMADIKQDKFDILELLHHYTSGMKSVFTQQAFDGAL